MKPKIYKNILNNPSHENLKLFEIKEMIKSKAKAILNICRAKAFLVQKNSEKKDNLI